jgi:hypothetical protein
VEGPNASDSRSCVDDCLDDIHAMRNSKLMWELAARGRHSLTSLIVQ